VVPLQGLHTNVMLFFLVTTFYIYRPVNTRSSSKYVRSFQLVIYFIEGYQEKIVSRSILPVMDFFYSVVTTCQLY